MKTSIITIIGPHAGETVESILTRKSKDIESSGFTLWGVANAPIHQAIDMETDRALFLEASSKNSAKPTKSAKEATEYSTDGGASWKKIPEGMSKVTGAIGPNYTALFITDMKFVNESLNLWDYSDIPSGPAKIALGKSTILVLEKDSSRCYDRMKSNKRKVRCLATLDSRNPLVFLR
jgi:hypothetical protein